MSKDKSRNNRTRKGAKSGDQTDPHRQRESAKYDQPIASREFITSTLRSEPGPLNYEALAEKLGFIGNEVAMEALRRRVGAMIRDGQLIENRRRGLVPVDADNLLAGRISAHPDGFGFVIVEDSDKDIFLNGKQMRQVLHGDKVVVCVTGVDHRGRKEGRIVDVVERANKSLVGRLSIDRGTVVVLPDNKRIHQDLLISPGELGDAEDGDMVVAEIVEQPTRRHQPVGKVIEVLGQHLRPGMEIDVALHSHGIPAKWPDAVLEQAASFSTIVDPSAAKGRKDVRDTPLVTIDGLDARDFDDAVWCEPLEKGWRLMVAIADVAHYVTPGSSLDVEAVERGTSVYFPGRVVPMLPEVLSNGLCSLNPEVDRLCMICELTLSSQGDVKKVRFHNGIMRSHARLTYDQVHEMLTDDSSALRNKHASLVPMIEELHKMYKVLAAKRRERGAIEFDSNETHIIFDDNKKIKEIVPIQRNDAHKLIEECMILANIQAAAYLEEKEIQALYRVHAGPKADRLEDLRSFLALNSLSLSGGDNPSALDYAALAEQIKDRPDRIIIQTVMLRSMQQAVYQPKNEGHFGLALDQYAHFTSPIRRYPDLLVHRALKFAIDGGKPKDYRYDASAMTALGESCSVTERRAEDASRDVVSWLKCEYMQDHVGAEFEGVISAVTSFGLFVDLTGIHIEGLIHITNLSRDFYRFDQAAQALKGERTGRQYRLGDSIKVQVAAVNLEERKIDFNEVASDGAVVRHDASDKRHKRDKGKHRDKAKSQKQTYQQSNNQKHKKDRSQVEQERPAANISAGQPEQQKAALSAEKRRQEKRKRKQKRRDKKRAEQREAKRALVAANASASAKGGDSQRAADSDNTKSSSKQGRDQKSQAGKLVAKLAAAAKAVGEKVGGKTAPAKKVASKETVEQEAISKHTGKKVSGKKVSSKKASATKADGKQFAEKKVSSKKTTAKKATEKKTTAKKVSSKKVSSKKAIAKKAAAKKATTKKVSSKKAASKKQVSVRQLDKKKAAGKSAVSKKLAKKKISNKKVASGFASGKKVAGKKASESKALSKKTAGKKASGGKVTSKKTASQKVSGSKVAGKKPIGKKILGKKAASKKVANKKIASGKQPRKKVAGKKSTGKKVTGKKPAGKRIAGSGNASKKVRKKANSKKTASKKATSKKAVAKRRAAGKKTGR